MALRVKKAGYQGPPGATVNNVVTLSGTQTITGEKYFNGTVIMEQAEIDSLTVSTGVETVDLTAGSILNRPVFDLGFTTPSSDTASDLDGFRLAHSRFGGSRSLGTRTDDAIGVKTLSGSITSLDVATEKNREIMIKSASSAYVLQLDFATSNTESTRSLMTFLALGCSTKTGENAGYKLRPASNTLFNNSASDINVPANCSVIVTAAGFSSGGKRACVVQIFNNEGRIANLSVGTLTADTLVVDQQEIDSNFSITGQLDVYDAGTFYQDVEITGELTVGDLVVSGTLTFTASTLADLSISNELDLTGADVVGNPAFLGIPSFSQEVGVSASNNFVTRTRNIFFGAYASHLAAKVADVSGTQTIDSNDGRFFTLIESSNSAFKLTLRPVTSVVSSGVGSQKYLIGASTHSGFNLVPSDCYLNGLTAAVTVPPDGIVRLIGHTRISGKINYIAEIFDAYGRQLTGLLDTAVDGDLAVSGGITCTNYYGLKESVVALEASVSASVSYITLFSAPARYELIQLICQLSSGTATIYVRAGGSNIAGPFSVNSTKTINAISAGAYVTEGTELAIYCSAASSPVNLLVQIDMKRVAP